MFNMTNQITDFLNYCSNRKALSYKTVKAYSIDLNQFCKFSEGQFDKEIICTYTAFLHKNFKPKTVKRKIATIGGFMKKSEYWIIQTLIFL